MRVSCLYLHKLSKKHFTVLSCSPTGLTLRLSFLDLSLKWNISHNKSKQALKFLEIVITGYLALTKPRKRKQTHFFRQGEMSSTHVGLQRRASTCLPPVMRSGTFGFSLTSWHSRHRPCCRCLKSLIGTALEMTADTPRTAPAFLKKKKEFIFNLQMQSQLYVYRSTNLIWKNMQWQRSVPKEDNKH